MLRCDRKMQYTIRSFKMVRVCIDEHFTHSPSAILVTEQKQHGVSVLADISIHSLVNMLLATQLILLWALCVINCRLYCLYLLFAIQGLKSSRRRRGNFFFFFNKKKVVTSSNCKWQCLIWDNSHSVCDLVRSQRS